MFERLRGMLASALNSLTGPSLRGTGYAIDETVLLGRLSEAIRRANVSTDMCRVKCTRVESPKDIGLYDAWVSPVSVDVDVDSSYEDSSANNQSEVLLRVALIAGDFKIWEGDLLLGTCSTNDASGLARLGEQAQLTVVTLKHGLIERHPGIDFTFIEAP